MIVNVSHQKGGVGKSTLTTNIAVALDAVIIDLDMMRASMLWNEIRKTNGHEALTCYTVGDPDELKELVRKNSDRNIVIDSGGYDSELTRFAIFVSDLILTPVAPSPVEWLGLQEFEKILQKIEKNIGQPIQTNVLINRADIRSKSAITDLQKTIRSNSEHFNLLNTVIHNRIDFIRAYGEGVSVLELDPTSKASNEIKRLVKEINS